MVKFATVVDYIKSVWESSVESAQELDNFPQNYLEAHGKEAKNFFRCEFVTDSGGIGGAITRTDDDFDRPTCDCACIVKHNQGSQDPSLPVETYAQTIHIEMTCPERYREFIVIIWQIFSETLKSVAVTLDDTTCVIKTTDLPVYSVKQANLVLENQTTAEIFKVSMDSTLIVFTDAVLSSSTTATATLCDSDGEVVTDSDGNEITGTIQWQAMDFKFTAETRADSQPRATLRFKTNTRQRVLHIMGIATSSSLCEALIADITNDTYVGYMWKITLTYNGTSTTDYYILLDGAAKYVYGSLLSFEVDFQLTF